ncbi:hypothetical protein PDN28_14250 [Bacillus cereus]|uniref:hypothetical protein n=1 Tax=Bacillus cereus TaxID=1396 RepID=UPI0024092DDF|nr:hypothetical protein [Bacillus cereus]MDA2267064.1 hypothetical protein [Bacillus cereus]MDC7777795.1 hypothetical protein [Bacillus cereus]
MAYGPDNSNGLIRNQVGWVKVPSGYRARFTYGSNAAWENAACIYPQDSDNKLAEAGNYSRRLDIPYETNTNHTGNDIWYMVTGWHKQGRPDGGLPWVQSAVTTLNSNPDSPSYGFEDSGGQDYDDMVVNVDILD